MTLIEQSASLIACSECRYTGTTQPGQLPPDAGSRCFACKGTMVKYVRADAYRGAVETLEGLEQLFEDRERAGRMHREDQAWRLVAAALRSARGQ